MIQPKLIEQLSEVDERNPLVPLALGSFSLLRKVEAALVREQKDVAESEDALLYVALGLVSLRKGLGRWLEECVEPRAEEKTDSLMHPMPPRELLR